jgi:hypothetical protein
MRALHERKHEQLEMIRAAAAQMSTGPALALQIGLGITGWLIDWCKATEERLELEQRTTVEV